MIFLDNKLTKKQVDNLEKEYNRVTSLLEDIAISIHKKNFGSAEHIMALGFVIGELKTKIIDERLRIKRENINKEIKNSL